ncbi:MAG: lipopolysaccharide biosynthesis protein [Alistipes sp.]|nr:lipopolysaccharide biosynthesis protein [Alistipes sp.]
MKGGELKSRVAGSVAWSFAEKACTMLLLSCAGIFVVSRLAPEDYGAMAVLTVLATIALALVDSGFSQALIRGSEPSQHDYSSVFAFNIAASIAAYLLLTGISPLLARFYDVPELTRIAPVLFLLLPLNALGVIQNTILARAFRFDLISKIVFASSAAGAAVAVVMAIIGCGVWSLVAQRVVQMGIKSLLLWIYGNWRPSRSHDTEPLRRLAPFGVRMMASEMVNTLCTGLPSLVIGSLYSITDLGYFNQAQKLKDMPVLSASQSVQNVTYPALSNINGDESKFAESCRQMLSTVAFVMFPLMAGLSAVAHDIFALLGQKWMPTVPYFRVICLAGLFAPLSAILLNVLKVRSDGRAVIRAEIVKKLFLIAVLAATLPVGIMAVVCGLVLSAAFELAVNLSAARRLCTLSLRAFAGSLLPAAAATAAMYAAVAAVGTFLPLEGTVARLAVQVATGAAVYSAIALLFRMEGAREILSLLKKVTRGE